MGLIPDHMKAAQRNRSAMALVLEDGRYPEWGVIAAFYTAVHMVEMMFAKADKHSASHLDRDTRLQDQQEYEEVWMSYRPLSNLSSIARYLTDRPGGTRPVPQVKSVRDLKFVSDHVVDKLLAGVESAVADIPPS